MPPNLVRLLLALALALAVPVQGFAAASAGLCMAFGHHGGAATHSHDAGDTHEDHAHDHGQPADTASHCAPCVACCAAAAISASPSPLVPDMRTAWLNAAAPPLSAGIQADTLDRPPLAL